MTDDTGPLSADDAARTDEAIARMFGGLVAPAPRPIVGTPDPSPGAGTAEPVDTETAHDAVIRRMFPGIAADC